MNWGSRICNPMPYHLAMPPVVSLCSRLPSQEEDVPHGKQGVGFVALPSLGVCGCHVLRGLSCRPCRGGQSHTTRDPTCKLLATRFVMFLLRVQKLVYQKCAIYQSILERNKRQRGEMCDNTPPRPGPRQGANWACFCLFVDRITNMSLPTQLAQLNASPAHRHKELPRRLARRSNSVTQPGTRWWHGLRTIGIALYDSTFTTKQPISCCV